MGKNPGKLRQEKNHPTKRVVFFLCWRKPIFPGRCQPSIFGAGELNFRVRDGNGWTLAAINTNYSFCRLSRRLDNNTTVKRKKQPFFSIFLNFFLPTKGKRLLWKTQCQQTKKSGARWCSLWVVSQKGKQKTTHHAGGFHRVGENLFFRAVASQVSSAPASLTSVFGMGTGGPSRQSTPTIRFSPVTLDSFYILPHPKGKSNPFFKLF